MQLGRIAGLFHSSIPVYVSKLTEAKGIEQSLIDWNEKADVEKLQKWRGNGGTVRSLSDAEQKKMIETVTPAVQKVIAEDPALQAAYNKIRSTAAKTGRKARGPVGRFPGFVDGTAEAFNSSEGGLNRPPSVIWPLAPSCRNAVSPARADKHPVLRGEVPQDRPDAACANAFSAHCATDSN